ncbi:MAG: N-acetyltransferase [Ideonella sp. MAG2]|nr:MAG: N-acetyltransferase [Ideonella sp. MAG2]
MSSRCFSDYRLAEAASFADESVACGRWPSEGALARSIAEFDELLPQGLATPKNYLYEMVSPEEGPTVGYLWFAAEERNGQQVAFIYDIQVREAYRRQGYARRALLELQGVAKSLGLSRVSLHVAGENVEAQALYAKLGFSVMGISMSKALSPDD